MDERCRCGRYFDRPEAGRITIMLFKKILVAVNDSEPAGWAVDLAQAMAEDSGAQLAIVHVVNRPHIPAPEFEAPSAQLLVDLRRGGEELLYRMIAKVPARLSPERLMREGKPSDEIIGAAGEIGASVIVMGAHGRSRLAYLLIGSTAEAVIRQAPCPVVTVRQQFHPPPENQRALRRRTLRTTLKHA